MDYYLGVAEKEGLSRDDIGAVQALVMAVAAGKVNAQMREVKGKRRK
ncbi:MAG: hypothetical protein P1P84_07390 [Deferrisomatales bacterium]|nr:hypothetical protein [Deferrisomatales bacterium]